MESGAGASSPLRSPSPPFLLSQCYRPEAPAINRGPASLPQGNATPPPPAVRTSPARPAEFEAPRRPAYQPSLLLLACGEAPVSPDSYPARVQDARGGAATGSALPKGAKTPWPSRRGHKGERGCHEGALLSPILRSPTLPPPPKIGAGGRSRRGDLEGGGQAAGRAGRGDGWTWTGNWKAKVWALNVRLHASQDQKRAQEIQRQPRGKEGTPGRPLFVCGSLSSSVRRK